MRGQDRGCFFFQAEDGIRDIGVTGVQTCALPISVIDAVLRPGDALYLPRGYLHSATALGAISAHLTVGIHSVTRWAAAESALDLVRVLAAEDPEIGRASCRERV